MLKAFFLAVLLLASITAAVYNPARSLTGVYYSKIAYCEHQSIAKWTCGACPKFPTMINVTTEIDEFHDSQGYVAYNPTAHEIVMAFRGTKNLQGWVVDGDFFQTKYDADANCTGCLVHEGLYWGYLRLASTLLPALQKLVYQYPTADILVTGHSMGAGMSGFGYPDVIRKIKGSRGTKRMYNYGSPRIGNPAFVAWADQFLDPSQEHFRCTNFGDPIPHLAPIVFDEFGLGDWLHVPREVFFENAFGNPMNYRVCKGTVKAEDPTCADSTPIFDMLSFRNHTTYLDTPLGCFLGPA